MGVAARPPPAGSQQEFPLQDAAAGIRARRADRNLLAAERVGDDVRVGDFRVGRHDAKPPGQVLSLCTVARPAARDTATATPPPTPTPLPPTNPPTPSP